MLGPVKSYVDKLNEATLEQNQNDLVTRKKFNPLRPSSAGGCPASLAYALNEFYGHADYKCKPFSAEASRIFALGNSIEDHIIHQFEASGVKVINRQQPLQFGEIQSKTKPEMKLMIQGSIDGILVCDGFMSIVDFKSVGGAKYFWDAKSKKYKSLKSVVKISEHAFWIEDVDAFIEELKDPFLESNLAQLNFYANNEWIRSLGVNHASLIQYSKVNSELRELRFKPSQRLFQKSLDRFQDALDAVAVGNPDAAPKVHEVGSVACNYCRYQHACRKTVSEESSAEQIKGA